MPARQICYVERAPQEQFYTNALNQVADYMKAHAASSSKRLHELIKHCPELKHGFEERGWDVNWLVSRAYAQAKGGRTTDANILSWEWAWDDVLPVKRFLRLIHNKH